MEPSDETELHRLTDLLREIHDESGKTLEMREALQKAGIALARCYSAGLRPDIDQAHRTLDDPLTELEMARLREMGIDPGSCEESILVKPVEQAASNASDSDAT